MATTGAAGAAGAGGRPDGTTADGLAVEHLADAPERSLIEIAEIAARRGDPLKVRTGLQLWNPAVKPYGAFRGWRGQSWILTLKGIEEARKLQQIIELVFDQIRLRGVDSALAEMQFMKARLDRQDANNRGIGGDTRQDSNPA